MHLSSQATWKIKIWRIMVQCQPRQKKFTRSHLKEKKLGVCLSSQLLQEVGTIKYEPAFCWLGKKARPYLQNNQSKKDGTLSSDSVSKEWRGREGRGEGERGETGRKRRGGERGGEKVSKQQAFRNYKMISTEVLKIHLKGINSILGNCLQKWTDLMLYGKPYASCHQQNILCNWK
jgi:hypothetical protein